jgi:uncharacterized membrane protein (GlpM family)
VEIVLRIVAAATMVVVLTALAATLGPSWSGLLTPFPVASSVVVAGVHIAEGPASLHPMLSGFLRGLYGFVAFLAVITFGLEALGLTATFASGVIATLIVQGLLFRRDAQRPLDLSDNRL